MKKHEHDKKEEKHPKKEKHLEELEKQNQELEVLRDKYLRLGAEFDNARKRWEREKEEVIKFANYTLLKDLTIVLDEMEQAMKMVSAHSDLEQIAKGIEMTYKNLLAVLFKKGLKVIEAEGKKFDPHLHEIVASREIEEGDEHVVLQEVQKGYFFVDKVLRTSKVIVGVAKQTKDKRPKTEGQEEEKQEQQEESEQ